MSRLSVSPAQVQRFLPEVLHLVRSQPLVWWSYCLRPRHANQPVGVCVVAFWMLLFMTSAGAPWLVAAVVAAVAGLVMWPVLVWVERSGLAALEKQLGCYVDFEQRVVREVAKTLPAGVVNPELFHGLYVGAEFDLKEGPADVWSIGVVQGPRYAREWNIELRHRSQGPVFRLCQVQPTVIPYRGVAQQVDELVDVLCQRLGVRRSGSRLRRLKRRQ